MMIRRLVLGYTFSIVEDEETTLHEVRWDHRARRPRGKPPRWVQRVHGTKHRDPEDAFNHIVAVANAPWGMVA